MTERVVPLPRDRHQELRELLPWYVTDTLPQEEREAVEIHLTHCAACRAELEQENELRASLVMSHVSDPLPEVEGGWLALSRVIDHDDDALPNRKAGFRPRLPPRSRLSTWRSQWLDWSMAAQIALVAFLTGWFAVQIQPARYHALSSGGAQNDANIVVAFRPETTESDLRQTLLGVDARIVDGPTAEGGYMLHVAHDRRNGLIQMLRHQSNVLLAEPVGTN
jgi:hypothetical protein